MTDWQDQCRKLREAIEELFAKATPHDMQGAHEVGGPYIKSYILPCGPLHRAIGIVRGSYPPRQKQFGAPIPRCGPDPIEFDPRDFGITLSDEAREDIEGIVSNLRRTMRCFN